MPRRRTAPLTALSLPLALSFSLALGACGSDEPGAAAPTSSTSSPTNGGDGASIEIEREDDAFSPTGARVEVPVGEPVTLVITSDEAGEMHVHSTPEQAIAYDPGTSEHEVVIDRPGVVEVESHDPQLVVLQLEAR